MKLKLVFVAVGMLSGCTFFGVDGQHNAWQEFYDRCLQQIMADRPVRMDGLVQRDITSIKQGLRARQNLTDTYWGPRNNLWVLQTNKERNNCKVYAGARGLQVYSQGSEWLKAAYDSGAFEPDHDSSDEGRIRFENGRTVNISVKFEEHNFFINQAVLYISVQ